jgi:hypothetical protein
LGSFFFDARCGAARFVEEPSSALLVEVVFEERPFVEERFGDREVPFEPEPRAAFLFLSVMAADP